MQYDIFSFFNKEEVDKFLKKHMKKCGNTSEFNFIIRGTGIGIYCEIQCQDCLGSADASDYEHW